MRIFISDLKSYTGKAIVDLYLSGKLNVEEIKEDIDIVGTVSDDEDLNDERVTDFAKVIYFYPLYTATKLAMNNIM